MKLLELEEKMVADRNVWTRMDKVRNKDIRSLVGVALIEDKMRENRL